MKAQLDKFFKDRKIIPEYHHDSRKGHSTLTATQTIQHILATNQDKNLNSSVLLTDLSSAFDTVDHQLLSKKLAHIGVRETAGELIR